MLLYALCINPLLQHLSDQLRGIQNTTSGVKTVAVAYADDVSIIITDPADIPKIQNALDIYMQASGAQVNKTKSTVLPVGAWDENLNVMNIKYATEMKILGITFNRTTEQSGRLTWAEVTGKVRALTCRAYTRDLCLTRRIWYAHTYRLSALWHTAQILPPTQEAIRQITSAVTRYIWKGNIFRVPFTTLYKALTEGGLGLIDIRSKCLALLIVRLWIHSNMTEGITHDWLKTWKLTGKPKNSPNLNDIPDKFGYLRSYALERTYALTLTGEQQPRHLKKLLYKTIRTFETTARPPPSTG
jgi:hypothetical protein